jgi:hypothetical protein
MSCPCGCALQVLVVSSFVFYGASGPEVLLAFLIAILWGYGTAFLFGRWPRAGAIAIAISVPALLLIMFKYLGFILDTVRLSPRLAIISGFSSASFCRPASVSTRSRSCRTLSTLPTRRSIRSVTCYASRALPPSSRT